MPRKPKHPCAYPSCKELTDNRYCLIHEKIVNKQYEMYKRSPETKKRYGRVWKRIRDAYAKEHPLCQKCYEEGKLVAMEQVHHIKPLSEGGTHDKENLISLCSSCHSKIHAARGDRWHSNKINNREGDV